MYNRRGTCFSLLLLHKVTNGEDVTDTTKATACSVLLLNTDGVI